MKPIKYLLFALCFASTFAVSARSPVEQDTIKIKITGRYDAFISAKGRNLKIEKTNFDLRHIDYQISDSTNEMSFTWPFSNIQQGGIAYIIGDSITEFSCSSSRSIDLDLRRCPSLRKLTLTGNIDSLDLSGNTNLEYFDCNECSFKNLQHLDMSHNPELTCFCRRYKRRQNT